MAEARHTSAQVIAKIAKIELPHAMWPELIEMLLKATLESTHEVAKQATLETLGYICEEVVRFIADCVSFLLSAR